MLQGITINLHLLFSRSLHPFNKLFNTAKYFYEKLKMKGVILRSMEEGYNIKNTLRMTIGSKKENLRFMKITKNIFKK